MGFLVKYIGGFGGPDSFSLFGDTFLDLPIAPIDATFAELTIQGNPSFDHGPELEPGDTRSVQMFLGVLGSGTVSSSGSAVIGSGTSFLSELSPGSYIKVSGNSGVGTSTHRVATVSDNQHLTIEDSFFPDVSGAVWVAITPQGDPVTLTGPDSQATGSLGGILAQAATAGNADKLAYFVVTRTGGFDPFDQRMIVEYTAADNASIYGCKISNQFSYSFTPPANSDYHNFGGLQSLTEADVQMVWPLNGSFSNLVVRLTDFGFASATEHVEVFLSINGVDTLLGIADAALTQGNDLIFRNDSDVASVSEGDLVSIRVKITSGGASEEELFGGSAYVVFKPTMD
jgi:hypothetical protein